MKAALTLTLLSSASALSLRKQASSRDLPAAVNGKLDISDTCDKYQTEDDCCAEVNCQFAVDKCTKRTTVAENGQCAADRGPPTNTAAGNAAFNKEKGSAAQSMMSSANVASVQVKTAGARSPPLPDEPACEGTGEPCTFPASGVQAAGMLDPELKVGQGGVIRQYVKSAEELSHLGKTANRRFEELKRAHISNQDVMDNALAAGSDEAAKSYAKRLMATNQFSKKVGQYEYSAKIATDSAKAFKGRLDDMMKSVHKDVEDATAVLEKRKVNVGKVVKHIEETKVTVAANLVAVAEQPADEDLCKSVKENVRKPWNKLDQDLTEMDTEAKTILDVDIPKFEKDMTELKKKTDDDKAAIDKTAADIDTAAGAYGEAVKTAVAEINKAEKAEMKRYDDSVTAAGASGAQMVQGAEMTGLQVGKDAAVMRSGDVKAAGVAAGKGLVEDASTAAASLLQTYQGKDGLRHLLVDAMRHARNSIHAHAKTGSGEDSIAAIEGHADNTPLLEAAKEIKVLEKEFKTSTPSDIHVDKFTTAMTHIDSMVVKMKLALECLKKYLAYYQVGATQTQTVLKTDHDEIVKVIRSHTVGLMAASKKVHEYNQVLIGDIAKAKSHVLKLKQFTGAMKTQFDMWDDKKDLLNSRISACPKWDPDNQACKKVKIVEPKKIVEQVQDTSSLAIDDIDDDFMDDMLGAFESTVAETDGEESATR